MFSKSIKCVNNLYWKTLSKKSTVELVRLIVKESDRTALQVLLDTRRVFRLKNGSALLLPEYLLEASMPLEEGRGLNPGDHFRVQVIRVNAREEVLKLTMV